MFRGCLPLRRADVGPALLALSLCAGAAQAADGVFELGTVTTTGSRVQAQPADEAVLGHEEIARRNADTVAEAVRVLPGVSLSRVGARNEEMVYVRGFDSRQVPVYVDGVPLYVPYDGYVDFSRFTTFDLAEIRVAKADASLLYGPNTLGGAINLVTRKPVKSFEGDALLGLGAGQMRKAAVNLGGNQGLWYYQIGASYLDADSFPLPKGFTDYKKALTDIGSERKNASRTDKRLSFKLGLTPNATDEYALSYVPAARAPEIVGATDILITTGTTLVNDTLDDLLHHLRPGAQAAVVGPTATLRAAPFARRGATVVGGTRVRAPAELLDLLAEGGSGYHFFGKSVERICLCL